MAQKNERSVKQFIIRYIRIITILFIGYLIIYFSFFAFNEYQALNHRQAESAASARMYLQTSINGVSQINYALRANKAVYNIMYAPFSADPYNYVDAYEEMSQRVFRSDLLESCYIYIVPSGTVLASGYGKMSLDTFFDSEFLLGITPDANIAYYLHTPGQKSNNAGAEHLVQVNRFSTSLRGNAGYIVTSISKDKLLNDIAAFTGYAWDIRIEVKDGPAFGTVGNDAVFDPGFYTTEDIGMQGLRVTLATSRSAFFRSLFTTFFRNATLFLFFAAVAGIVLAGLVTSLNKTFQAMILELAGMYAETNADIGLKELDFYFKKLVRESKEYSARLSETSNIAKDKLLLDLLLGNTKSTDEYEKMSRYLGIKFEFSDFIVACISLDGQEESLPPETMLGAQAIIRELIERETDPIIYSTATGNTEIGAIINFSDDQAARDILIGLAERIRGEMERYNVLGVFVSFSKAVKMGGIPSAYISARYNVSRKYFDNKQCYVFDPSPNAGPAPLITEQLRHQVASATRGQDFQTVYTTLRTIAAPYQSAPDAKQAYELMAILLILAGDIFSITANDADERVLKLYLSDLSRIHLAEGAESAYAATVAFVNTVSREYLLSYQPYNMNHYTAEAVQYIERQFARNIGVNDIATHLSLNPKYFSRLFKNHTGLTVMQYLSEVRMKKAIELLETTSLPIREVGEMVGFTDSRSFIRHFKKHHGKTPGQFRLSE